MTASTESKTNAELRDANTCIALGAGLGAVSAGTALVAGAACPLCVVLAPALIAFGAWKRLSASRRPSYETPKEHRGPASPYQS
ncbi:MAG: hypothetical protein JNG89_17300 [Planctomycetaceae bacterium]|nr:hypothetical protein [Planctomycetaceae bacterium]